MDNKKYIPFFIVGFLLFLLINGCKPGIPGIDSMIKIEDGSVRVVKVERGDYFIDYSNHHIIPDNGYDEFILVTIKVKGKVPSAGVDADGTNIGRGNWTLFDSTGEKYKKIGISDGTIIFGGIKPSTGLVLKLGKNVSIPLDSIITEYNK
jgi:hypothetical protein